jgi:hypothetical protein
VNDMSAVIVAKSDQQNADDFLSGSRTITITRVEIRPGTEQPVSIFFDGDDGKPWKPCKSMSRVLVAAWGPDAKVYVGRSATLHRDPNVTWGGMAVGGIRISHLSHIEHEMVAVLMASNKKKAPFKVKPLANQPATQPASNGRAKAEAWSNQLTAAIDKASEKRDLDALLEKHAATLTKLRAEHGDLCDAINAAVAKRFPDPGDAGPSDDPFAEGPADNQRGEAFATVDAEADILDHLSRKTTVIDVNSLIAARLGELDEDAQQRVRDAATARIEELRGQ